MKQTKKNNFTTTTLTEAQNLYYNYLQLVLLLKSQRMQQRMSQRFTFSLNWTANVSDVARKKIIMDKRAAAATNDDDFDEGDIDATDAVLHGDTENSSEG